MDLGSAALGLGPDGKRTFFRPAMSAWRAFRQPPRSSDPPYSLQRLMLDYHPN